jgi:carboxymethylenebutenolidase
MSGTSTVIDTADGQCPVTLHTPDGPGPWTAVVMYPDAGGVRPVYREMADRLAGYGYTVLRPDVYYRHGKWQPFAMRTVFDDADERARLMSMVSSVTADMVSSDATAYSISWLSIGPSRAIRSGCAGTAWEGACR